MRIIILEGKEKTYIVLDGENNVILQDDTGKSIFAIDDFNAEKYLPVIKNNYGAIIPKKEMDKLKRLIKEKKKFKLEVKEVND